MTGLPLPPPSVATSIPGEAERAEILEVLKPFAERAVSCSDYEPARDLYLKLGGEL
jgi:hypothetical protein